MSGKLTVVVGGQYGSEGKGMIAGYLCEPERFGAGIAVRVAGPNAGHSAVGRKDGVKWALRQIPVAAVTNPEAQLVIAAGSEVDPDVLNDEIRTLDDAGYGVSSRLSVDPQATIIHPYDREVEGQYAANLVERIGSTGKGIGAARSARILRGADRLVGEYPGKKLWDDSHNTADLISRALHARLNVLIEGTQGYGLGLHAGHYPQTTSSDCRAIDFMAMAGVSPWDSRVYGLEVWVVFRVYPIRVAGNSGPLLGETTWHDLGLEEELTTVTKKVRRVGQWDPMLARKAINANGGGLASPHVRMALTMLDQRFPELSGMTDPTLLNTRASRDITTYELDAGSRIKLVGTGPNSVMDLR